MDAPRSSTISQDVVANMVPNSAQLTGKNAASATGRATLLSSAVAKEMLILLASDLPCRNKYPDPRRSFTRQLQTQRAAKQTSQSTTLMRSRYKFTLWKQRLKKPSLPRCILAINCPCKHVTKVYLDKDQSPGVLYVTVELELPDRSVKKLTGRFDTEAQVNLMNNTTFREIFGNVVCVTDGL